MAHPLPLSPADAKEKILLKLNEGKFELPFHCRYESMPKRGIKTADILNALETGEIKRAPEWSSEHQNWKYRVEGFDTDEEELTAITVILETVLVVTAF